MAARSINVRVRGQKLQIPFEANILRINFTHQYGSYYLDNGITADTNSSVLYIDSKEAITLPHLLKPHLSEAPSFDNHVLHDDELDFLTQCVTSRVRAILTAAADCLESFFFLIDVVLVCSEPEHEEEDEEEEEAAKGASSSALLKLKKESFDGGEGVCCVCLDEFLASVSVARMPCNHVFHDCCILRWLQQADTCPICRQQLLSN